MTVGEIILYTIIALSLTLLIITGVSLIRRGKASNQYNLVILGINELLICISYILIAFTDFWIYINIQMVTLDVLYLIFIRKTFYQKRTLTFRLILINVLGLGAICIGIAIAHSLQLIEKNTIVRLIDTICTNGLIIPVFLWYFLSAKKARIRLKGMDVEPWILTRLKIIEISSLLGAFVQVSDFLRIYPAVDLADPNNIISVIIFYIQSTMAVVGAVLQYFAWMMPPKLKNRINKNYKKDADLDKIKKLSEDEILFRFKEDST